nr:type II secretion system minor pseudopilin GspK [Paraburkholderia sp. PGU19]
MQSAQPRFNGGAGRADAQHPANPVVPALVAAARHQRATGEEHGAAIARGTAAIGDTLPDGGQSRDRRPNAAAKRRDGGGNYTDQPGLEDTDENAPVAPLQMTGVDSLLDVPGFTPEMIARLRPFVTVLPTTTPVNMNTAPAEVVAAVVPGMNLSNAQAFVARRETVFFHNVGDVQLALRGAGVQQLVFDPNQLDVNTSYFLIHGRVEHERAEVDRTTLVYRDALTHTTRIVWGRDQL